MKKEEPLGEEMEYNLKSYREGRTMKKESPFVLIAEKAPCSIPQCTNGGRHVFGIFDYHIYLCDKCAEHVISQFKYYLKKLCYSRYQ